MRDDILLSAHKESRQVALGGPDGLMLLVNAQGHVAIVGAFPLIPFKSNATGGQGPMGIWRRLFHYFNLHRDTFMTHYHKRSNVETTFHMIKSKFGEALRSKSDVAQFNEALCKVLCHNLCCVIQSMHELGISPDFGAVQTA